MTQVEAKKESGCLLFAFVRVGAAERLLLAELVERLLDSLTVLQRKGNIIK